MPEHLLVETRDRVGLLRINRPQRMNALNDQLAREICEALFANDADPAIGCSVLTGNDKAFAAGADIGAMADWDYAKVYGDDYITKDWEGIRRVRKPVIAAVAGYALGGGCELAMACDIIIAADTAKFGQPEVTIGTMPGFGGTQRLPRAVGKAKAMEWCLTGRMIGAEDAERAGLVARVVPAADLETEALAHGGENRVVLAAGRAEDQGSDQSRVRIVIDRRPRIRTPGVPCDVRARRSEGRHARVRREAQAAIPPPVATEDNRARAVIAERMSGAK